MIRNKDSFRERLHNEKKRVEELIARTNKHLYRREEPYSQDFAEQAVEVENNQVVEQLDEDGKASLVRINKALKKLDEGYFGLCEDCGEPIDQDRLLIVPTAPCCVDCAKLRE